MPASWKESHDKPRRHIKKQRHHLLTKVRIIKAMVFLVVMYGIESWTIKKAECQGIDAFELWCWRRLLRVPWTARSNWSVVKKINTEYSLEGVMLKLKLQHFGHLMWRANSLEKTPKLGMVKSQRKRERQRMRWLDSITNSMDMNLSKLGDSVGQGSLACCNLWGRKESDMTEQLNWTEAVILNAVAVPNVVSFLGPTNTSPTTSMV